MAKDALFTLLIEEFPWFGKVIKSLIDAKKEVKTEERFEKLELKMKELVKKYDDPELTTLEEANYERKLEVNNLLERITDLVPGAIDETRINFLAYATLNTLNQDDFNYSLYTMNLSLLSTVPDSVIVFLERVNQYFGAEEFSEGDIQKTIKIKDIFKNDPSIDLSVLVQYAIASGLMVSRMNNVREAYQPIYYTYSLSSLSFDLISFISQYKSEKE